MGAEDGVYLNFCVQSLEGNVDLGRGHHTKVPILSPFMLAEFDRLDKTVQKCSGDRTEPVSIALG